MLPHRHNIPACKAPADGASFCTMPFYIYAITVFSGSFLLFVIQPMAAKALLPVYGGSAMVWGSVMFFFQCMVLGGYLWAHFIMRWRRKTASDLLHCAIMATPLLAIFTGLWQISSVRSDSPGGGILLHLLVTIGVPVFVLCTVSVTLQHWLTRTKTAHGTDTYRLYAFSNAGSLIALLAYPVIFEPLIPLPIQRMIWWWLLAITVLINMLCCPALLIAFRKTRRPQRGGLQDTLDSALDEWPTPPAKKHCSTADSRPLPRGRFGRWVIAAAAPCALMVAFTHHITRNLAAVPFLWIMPLAIYLLTFIIAFRRKPVNTVFVSSLLPWLALIAFLLHGIESFQLSLPAIPLLLLAALTLGGLCLNCTTKLSASRPTDDADLSLFYLAIAIGGCIGGAVTGWLPPLLTNATIEMPLAVALVCLACTASNEPANRSHFRNYRQRLRLAGTTAGMLCAWLLIPLLAGRYLAGNSIWAAPVFAVCAAIFSFSLLACRTHLRALALLLALAALLSVHTEALFMGAGVVTRGRNYYGMYRVLDRDGTRYLQHEGTLHGRESLDPARRGVPLGYYHLLAPAGAVMANPPLPIDTIAMIGLGTGALAAHCSTGQTMHIIEIDPDGPAIAEKYFTFLAKARDNGARLVMHRGDGRNILNQSFDDNSLDLLIIDAFSGGAIPVHLLTQEAFNEYARVLKPEGMIIAHISNRYLQLAPVVAAGAAGASFSTLKNEITDRFVPEIDPCLWVALTRDRRIHAALRADHGWSEEAVLPERQWTDDYSNLLRALW